MQRLLTLTEAADVLGYSVSGFRKLLRAGRGPQFTRAGERGQFRFRPEWLEGFADAGASAPKQKKRPAIADGSQFGFDSRLLNL